MRIESDPYGDRGIQEAPPANAPENQKPKRARKPKAPKQPKVEKPKRERTKPVQTLKARVAAISQAHLSAFRLLSRDDAAFRDGLRREIEYDAKLLRAQGREDQARLDHEDATVARKLVEGTKPDGSFRARLDRLAASIANEVVNPNDDEPSGPDTAPPRHENE